jgi:hypothetical protein
MDTIRKKHLMTLRKKLSRQLFLLLVLALSLVPVFQAAHMLTHVVPADMIGMIQVDGGLHQDEDDADAAVDKICLDCLALTGFSVIFFILAVWLSGQGGRCPPVHEKSRNPLPDFSFTYLTRAPPQA